MLRNLLYSTQLPLLLIKNLYTQATFLTLSWHTLHKLITLHEICLNKRDIDYKRNSCVLQLYFALIGNHLSAWGLRKLSPNWSCTNIHFTFVSGILKLLPYFCITAIYTHLLKKQLLIQVLKHINLFSVFLWLCTLITPKSLQLSNLIFVYPNKTKRGRKGKLPTVNLYTW